jgi:hypothetical protein
MGRDRSAVEVQNAARLRQGAAIEDGLKSWISRHLSTLSSQMAESRKAVGGARGSKDGGYSSAKEEPHSGSLQQNIASGRLS